MSGPNAVYGNVSRLVPRDVYDGYVSWCKKQADNASGPLRQFLKNASRARLSFDSTTDESQLGYKIKDFLLATDPATVHEMVYGFFDPLMAQYKETTAAFSQRCSRSVPGPIAACFPSDEIVTGLKNQALVPLKHVEQGFVAYAEHVKVFVQDLHATQKKAKVTSKVATGAAIVAVLAGRMILGEHGGRIAHRAIGGVAAYAAFAAVRTTFGSERHLATAQASLLEKWDRLEKAVQAVADELHAQAEYLAAALYGYFISQAVVALAKADRRLADCSFEKVSLSISLPPLVLAQMNGRIQGMLADISRAIEEERFTDASHSCDAAVAALLGDEPLTMAVLGCKGESYLFDFLHLRAKAFAAQSEQERRAGNVQAQVSLLAQLLSVPPVIGYSETAPASVLEQTYWRAYVTLVSHETTPIEVLSVAVRFAAGLLWQADNLASGPGIPGESGSGILVSAIYHTSGGLTSLNVRHPLGNTLEEGRQVLASRSIPTMGMAVFRLTRSFADQQTWQSTIGKLIRRNAFHKIGICFGVASAAVALLLIYILAAVISSGGSVPPPVIEAPKIASASANAGEPPLSSPPCGATNGVLPEEEISAGAPAAPISTEERAENSDASKKIDGGTEEVPDAAAYTRTSTSPSRQSNLKRDGVIDAEVARIEATGKEENKRGIAEANTRAPEKTAESIRAAEVKAAQDRTLALQELLECASCVAPTPIGRLNEWSQLQLPLADAPASDWVDHYVLRFEYINRYPDLPVQGYLREECRRLRAAAQRYASKGISYEQFEALRVQEEKDEVAFLRVNELRTRPAVLPSGPRHVPEPGAVLRF